MISTVPLLVELLALYSSSVSSDSQAPKVLNETPRIWILRTSEAMLPWCHKIRALQVKTEDKDDDENMNKYIGEESFWG